MNDEMYCCEFESTCGTLSRARERADSHNAKLVARMERYGERSPKEVRTAQDMPAPDPRTVCTPHCRDVHRNDAAITADVQALLHPTTEEIIDALARREMQYSI